MCVKPYHRFCTSRLYITDTIIYPISQPKVASKKHSVKVVTFIQRK